MTVLNNGERKQFRKIKGEMFRRCPICNFESPMLIKSKNYVSGEEKKKKFYELKQEKKITQNNQ